MQPDRPGAGGQRGAASAGHCVVGSESDHGTTAIDLAGCRHTLSLEHLYVLLLLALGCIAFCSGSRFMRSPSVCMSCSAHGGHCADCCLHFSAT